MVRVSVAQPGRADGWYPLRRWFKSSPRHQCYGPVAQVDQSVGLLIPRFRVRAPAGPPAVRDQIRTTLSQQNKNGRGNAPICSSLSLCSEYPLSVAHAWGFSLNPQVMYAYKYIQCVKSHDVTRFHFPSLEYMNSSKPARETTLPHPIGVGFLSSVSAITESARYLDSPRKFLPIKTRCSRRERGASAPLGRITGFGAS